MQMIRARCAACAWEFDVVAAPMPLALWARTAKARSVCPMCGHAKGNMLSPVRALDEMEAAHLQRLVDKAAAK